MGCCETAGRVLLVVINIFFLLIGLACFVGGLIARFGQDILNSQIESVLNSLKTSAAQSSFGVLDLSNFSITDLLNGLAIFLICFGLLICIVTVLGFVGGCYKIQIVLIVYVVVCIVLLTGQIVVIGILYGSPDTFHNPAKDALKSSIKSNYMGLNGTNVVSIGWNVVMQQMKCCGVDSYADFTGAENWVTVYASYTLKTPLACCKSLPSSTDFTCASTTGATTTNNYLNTGCYMTIWDLTIGRTAIVAGVLGGIGAFQLILIVYGIVVCCATRKNKTEPVSDRKKKKRKK